MIKITDFKGDVWELVYTKPDRYLHAGMAYWKVWYMAPTRPEELKKYDAVPLPIFTDWWPHVFNL